MQTRTLAVLMISVFLGFQSVGMDASWNRCVRVSAEVGVSPPQITLSWPAEITEKPISYTVYRKKLNEKDWGLGKMLDGAIHGYVDLDVEIGGVYEYQVMRTGTSYSAYGYVLSGIEAPPIHSRGKVLLLIDEGLELKLAPEIARLRQDLVGDGWQVVALKVKPTENVVDVKARIMEVCNKEEGGVKSLILLGHLPVPYSGDIYPDGHVKVHQGAWPADGYYGDLDGVWTDTKVESKQALNTRNWNIIGDGKFDQSEFPSPIELEVGRIDLSGMPGKSGFFKRSGLPNEVELTRRYLKKNHDFRHRTFEVQSRAIIQDSFGVMKGEAFAASGWRNFTPLVGGKGIRTVPGNGSWMVELKTNSYLWTYSCGGGSFTTMSGMGTRGENFDASSLDLIEGDPKVVFNMFYGSWFGDWDSEDNLMRAVLATPSMGLACVWSGGPHWFLHSMGLGQTIGYSTRLTQNNDFDKLYKHALNHGARQVHIALMGDPTLRMHYVDPPSKVSWRIGTQGNQIYWKPSKDSGAEYFIYSAEKEEGPYDLLNEKAVQANEFSVDPMKKSGFFMVRAVKLETTSSGSYYNLSQGVFLKINKN